MIIHVVQPNETIASIAQNYGVSANRLKYDNEIYNEERLIPGQALLVLLPAQVHLVKQGESLYSIAKDYQVSVISLVRNNPYLIDQNGINPGESIVISYQDQKERSITTNGYVYPFVTREVLEHTLPYLNFLSIFAYGFTMDGTLTPIEDEDIIEITRKYGVEPVLVLAPQTDGAFNNELVSAVAQNAEVRENLIDQLLTTVRERNYSGVNIDFEYIKGEDRVGFAEFVSELREVMDVNGYFVSVCLAPKTSTDQPGLLYEGMDYSLLGQSADIALLMTYEWGYTYGPPLPVAPINEVRKVVDFAVTQMEPEIIELGLPNYGYDWSLPFVKGESKARTLGLNEALWIAASNNASIEYDDLAQSPYFTYTKDDVEHIVWFEDVRSIREKFNLMSAENLKGVFYWQLMKYFRPNWLLLNALFEIE